MKKRLFGKTGKKVSEVGFGAWQLGNDIDWAGMTEPEAIQLVHEALSLGVNFFDTAPGYGHGKSEEFLGKSLKEKRHEVVISSKFGHDANGHTNFNENFIRQSVENSLKRLQTDYLDSLLLHNPEKYILEGKTQHFEVLEELKKEGKILAYGASVDTSHDMMTLMENSNSQVIETMFNIFHQETKKAFNMANENEIAIIVKVPLDSGWLTGKYTKNAEFHDIRSRWSKEVIERRFDLLEEIKEIVGSDLPLSKRALEFILSYPEISTVIPGAKNIKQLKANVESANHEMPEEMRYRLIQLWEEKLEKNPLPW